jgi:hypothetical protein
MFLFIGFRPVAPNHLSEFFLFTLPGVRYQIVQIFRNALLGAYSATANALFLLRCSVSVVP